MIRDLVNQAVAVKQWSAARHTNEAKGSIGHFQVAFASVSKRVFVRNHSYGNMFALQVHLYYSISI